MPKAMAPTAPSSANGIRYQNNSATDFGVNHDGLGNLRGYTDGVALAAIQGLNEKVEVRSQKAENRMQKLEAENAELQQRLAALERLVSQLHPKGE
jgi:hypothetical protein